MTAMNFANNAGSAGGATIEAKPVAAVRESDEIDAHGEFDYEEIHALGKGSRGGCNICGSMDHWMRDCPEKKGKGKGLYQKGYGKGKGATGPCFNCGEYKHLARDCPKPKGYSKGKENAWGKSKGKGFGYKGKGKGWINGVSENWNGGYMGDWDQSWIGGNISEDSFCSIRTIVPGKETQEDTWKTPRRTISFREAVMNNQPRSHEKTSENQFQMLDDNDEDQDEVQCQVFCEDLHVGCAGECINKIVKIEPKGKKKENKMPRVSRWKKMRAEELNPIKTIEPANLNVITADGKWEEIELAVDSGATESVVPESLPGSIQTVEGPASKRGVMYEVASGHQIPNEGEKRFCAVTEEGKEKKMTLQVADVNQGLLSVSKAMKAGNRVVFDEEGSYIESKRNGDKTWMRERNGMFILKLWVRRPF